MGKRILIIEDDIDILSIFEMILEEEGYELLLKQTGLPLEEAILFKPDLILLDVRLEGFPKLGTEICTEFKESRELANIPMILISSEHNLEVLADGCHADGFLSKPFQIDKLINKVKEFIN